MLKSIAEERLDKMGLKEEELTTLRGMWQ